VQDLPGRYIFLLQPAEEKLAGALAMIEAGVLDMTHPDWVVGCHLSGWNPVGTILARPGVALSDGQGLRFELRGAGGHGAFGIVKGNVVLRSRISLVACTKQWPGSS
jgi:metal-dependent amidase/aminoacylase/carboxypeptidase family protein